MRLKLIVILFLLSVFLSSCGYRFGYGTISEKYRSFSVPYVEGDRYGYLTNAIIKELSTRGVLRLDNQCPDLVLKIKILNIDEENIGFRYDRKKDGNIRDAIIPNETRICAFIEMSVYDTQANCCVVGPVKLSASVDYDHDYVYGSKEVNVFSLGQLTDQDTARQTVKRPLYDAVAIKVVDYISNACW